jgi:hypothetical protein
MLAAWLAIKNLIEPATASEAAGLGVCSSFNNNLEYTIRKAKHDIQGIVLKYFLMLWLKLSR